MKVQHVLSGSILLCLIHSAKAQETPTVNLALPQTIKKVEVCEVYVSGGFVAQSTQYAGMAEYNKLAPQSKLLKSDFSTYSKSGSYGANSSGMFSVLMGMHFGKKDKSDYKANPIFRVGFTYFNNTNFSSSYYQNTTKRYDTLLSYQTGQEFYIDSVSNRGYSMSYSSQQIRLDLSLIYRTDGKARWSFYSGIGASVGMSLNAYTTIDYYNNASIQTDNTSYYPSSTFSFPSFSFGYGGFGSPNNGTNSYQSETFKNKNNTAFSAYVPLGVDFRIGKKRTFWKRTHLFCEFRPGINSVSIPELGTYNSAYFQTNFGVKINWEKF